MLRMFFISLSLVLSLITSSGLQAEQGTAKPAPESVEERKERMTSALLKIQVNILAVSPHVTAEMFALLAEEANPAYAGAVVAAAVESIMLKAIAKEGNKVDDEAGFEQQMRAFAKKVGIEFEELLVITKEGTTDKEVLEKIWQQEQISAEEFAAIEVKVRDATTSEQRKEILKGVPIRLYHHFAVLTVAGRGILAQQNKESGAQEEDKLLGTDELFTAIKDNYDALVEFGLAEGSLAAEKYAAPEALTTELATSVDSYVDNINATIGHGGSQFFKEKLSG